MEGVCEAFASVRRPFPLGRSELLRRRCSSFGPAPRSILERCLGLSLASSFSQGWDSVVCGWARSCPCKRKHGCARLAAAVGQVCSANAIPEHRSGEAHAVGDVVGVQGVRHLQQAVLLVPRTSVRLERPRRTRRRLLSSARTTTWASARIWPPVVRKFLDRLRGIENYDSEDCERLLRCCVFDFAALGTALQ